MIRIHDTALLGLYIRNRVTHVFSPIFWNIFDYGCVQVFESTCQETAFLDQETVLEAEVRF